MRLNKETPTKLYNYQEQISEGGKMAYIKTKKSGKVDVQMEDEEAIAMAKQTVTLLLKLLNTESFAPEFDDLFDQIEQIVKRRR